MNQLNRLLAILYTYLAGQFRRYPYLAAILLAIIVMLFAIFGQTGFSARSLWDWMELLIIPAVLGAGALWFNQRESTIAREVAQKERDTDLQIAQDKRHEDILQNYFDKMTELMIDDDWLAKAMIGVADTGRNEKYPLSPKAERLFDIARVRTVTTLRALEGDTRRQTSIMHFLRESDLYNPEDKPALLAGAIMKSINLAGLDLRQINFQDAMLSYANLRGARLVGTDLQRAYLRNADLNGADLSSANLQGAHLDIADLQGADLGKAMFDEKTTLPDGTHWTSDTDMASFTNPAYPDFWQSETQPPDGET